MYIFAKNLVLFRQYCLCTIVFHKWNEAKTSWFTRMLVENKSALGKDTVAAKIIPENIYRQAY